MTGIENASHDLEDAVSSVETALALLRGIEHDSKTPDPDLHWVVAQLAELKGGLDEAYDRLQNCVG